MQLSVGSAALREALAMAVQQSLSSRTLMLSFKSGMLQMQCGEWSHSFPAEGEWAEEVIVQMGWARRLHGKPLEADPVRLRVENRRLYAEDFASPCALMSTMDPFDPMLRDPKDEERIKRATRLLGQMVVEEEDLRSTVQKARERALEPWNDQRLKTLRMVAEAWVLLSPFGVTIEDIQLLIDEAPKRAWGYKGFNLMMPGQWVKQKKRKRGSR